jgi:uncharacterized protein
MGTRNSLKIKLLFSVFIFLFIGLIYCLSLFFNGEIELKKSPEKVYADNSSASFIKISYKNKLRQELFPFKGKFDVLLTKNKEIVEIIKAENGFFIKGKFTEGKAGFKVKINRKEFKDQIEIIANLNDFNRNGFPDVCELDSEDDRNNFISWFTVIAESQFYAGSVSWEEINQSCSGLIVFAFKEALKKHGSDWAKRYQFLTDKNIPDVMKYNYPEVPLLGDKIFRTKKGEFKKDDIASGIFAGTADVNNLLNFNMVFIGRTKNVLKKGDVLFFIHPEDRNMPYHSIIYTGEYLVYHTGPIDENPKGEVRKVKFDNLLKHPDSRWHPVQDNPGFLGIYRWKILLNN